MKNLKIFGDSIIKGVTYNGQSYHLCQEHDFDTLRAQGVTVENNAKMGATIDAGLKQLDRKLGTCDGDTTVLFCFGGNDCDYDWKAISEDPDGEHLPHTPSEKFIDQYCTAIRKAQSAGARVAMTSLPPLEQERYFSFITRGLSAENILHWLGDTDHLYRWQEYYNAMVAQLSRAFGCRLLRQERPAGRTEGLVRSGGFSAGGAELPVFGRLIGGALDRPLQVGEQTAQGTARRGCGGGRLPPGGRRVLDLLRPGCSQVQLLDRLVDVLGGLIRRRSHRLPGHLVGSGGDGLLHGVSKGLADAAADPAADAALDLASQKTHDVTLLSNAALLRRSRRSGCQGR